MGYFGRQIQSEQLAKKQKVIFFFREHFSLNFKTLCFPFSRPEKLQFNWAKKKRSNQIRPSKRNRGGEQENQQGQEMQCRRQDELQQPNQGLRQQQPNDIEAIETL